MQTYNDREDNRMNKRRLIFLATLFLFAASACSSKKDTVLPVIHMLVYNDAYYEIISDHSQLEKAGISIRDVAQEEHIAWLEKTADGFEVTDDNTQIELLAYRNTEQKAVMIINEKGSLSAAVFSNFITKDTDTAYEFSELFSIYGIHDSSDISAVYKTDWSRASKGKTVTDQKQISILYTLLTNAQAYGNDSFQQMQFGRTEEEKQTQAHAEFSDELHEICMMTKDGLKMYIGFYPESGWMNGYGSMSWYTMTDEMLNWYNENIR